MDLGMLSISEILVLLQQRKLSSEKLISFCLKQIDDLNKNYNVFLFVRDKKELLEEAKSKDKQREKGSDKKLLGIPFSLKDSYNAKGTPTTAGDLYLKDTYSEYTATIVQKLLDEGAILVGKVNMDCWGFGSSTENSSYGPTSNAKDLNRIAGGSSGGSAVSVALGMCAFSIAEDTGGSIRNPANYNNVYGLKPTNGRVSRFGCIAYGSSLDTVGPIAKSAQDIELIFEVIKGKDTNDMTSVDYKQTTNRTPKRKFAYSNDFIIEGIDPEVKQNYLETIEKFKELGYEAVEYSFPTLKLAVPTYYVTAMSEASTNLARYNGTRYGNFNLQSPDFKLNSWEDLYKRARTEGLNEEAKRRVFLGAYVSSEGFADAYYKKAQKTRYLILREIQKVLDQVDFILSPVTPTVAPEIGKVSDDPAKEYLSDIFTVTANLAQIPALAFPSGNNAEGMPIGMQIMGEKGSDEMLLQVLKDWRI